MNRSQNDVKTLEKVNMIVNEKLPGFASRYFNYNMELKAPGTLYGYALDLTAFFDYLGSMSIKVDKMVISDLDKITPSLIEDFLEYSKTYVEQGKVIERSDCAIKRRYSSISSFIKYFYDLDMIDRNPASKVKPPAFLRNKTKASSNTINKELLNFISCETMEGRSGAMQDTHRNRDIALVALIIEAGLKASDCVNLNLDNLHLENGYLLVRGKKSPRKVYVSDYVLNALGTYLNERLCVLPVHGHENALFLSLQRKRICVRAVEKMLKLYSSALFGRDNSVTSFALSLSFKDNMFQQTGSIKRVADYFGNRTETIMLRYLPLFDENEEGK